MKSAQEKEIFMSKLWMLKNFKRNVNLSVTNDYTLDERKIIRNCVEEAKKRNMKGVKSFLWKVQGTPREGMRIVKINKELKRTITNVKQSNNKERFIEAHFFGLRNCILK